MRRRLSAIGLAASLMLVSLAFDVDGAAALLDGTRPPITTPPPAGDIAPPADVIVPSHDPTTTCGDWSLQSTYGGHWPTSSTWWEYRCDSGGWEDYWSDYYYWDGSQSVFYGQWFAYASWDNEYYWDCFWWDETANDWYGAFSCSDANPGLPPNVAPEASFTFTCSGLTCNFDGNGSSDSDGTWLYFYWDFGDHASSGGNPNVSHTYPEAGSYTVTLTVTDDRSATDTASQLVGVEGSPPAPPSPNEAPTASFRWSCFAVTCTFDGSGSKDSDGAIQSYNWDFGDTYAMDGSSTTAEHAYLQAGTYTVRLTVTDNGGATATASNDVTLISLTANGYTVKGVHQVDLSWSGSGAAPLDVYRNGGKIATVAGNAYTDIVGKGRGTYTYKVCEAATSTCSNEAAVGFRHADRREEVI